MSKFIFTSLLALAACAALATSAEARGRGCCCGGGGTVYAAPAPAATAPAAPATDAAPPAMAQANTNGYRSYSYQPAVGTAAPAMMRSYNSAPYRNPWDYPKTDSRRFGGR